ncbi:DUF5105 domain-containing protein [Anaerofustis sp. HA2171]|uniref:DUF5105 domain-containing protein n=1 Tax=Anaerofustis butyriciformans TaxID=3108533 RepID=UPI002E2FACCB|nr:DUF5105 domain-containing protein [Anaerofustis sp. HA2171]
MKKIIALIMSIFVIFSLTGCGGEKPEDFLKTYLDIMCCKDEDKVLEKYINGEEVDEQYKEYFGDDLQYFKSSGIDEFMLSIYKNLNYEIISVEEDGDKANAKVSFSVIDFGKAYDQAMKDSVKWFMDNTSASDSDITNKLMENFTKEINNAAKEGKFEQKEVTMILSKDDEGYWNVDNMNSAMNDLFEEGTNDINDINNNIESYFY